MHSILPSSSTNHALTNSILESLYICCEQATQEHAVISNDSTQEHAVISNDSTQEHAVTSNDSISLAILLPF